MCDIVNFIVFMRWYDGHKQHEVRDSGMSNVTMSYAGKAQVR